MPNQNGNGFKRTDLGYGWGRVCVQPGCGTVLNHLSNEGPRCHQCEARVTGADRYRAGWARTLRDLMEAIP